jgi:hypothetical protein
MPCGGVQGRSRRRRESPALRVAELAVERGYDVRLCDPHLARPARLAAPLPIEQAVRDAGLSYCWSTTPRLRPDVDLVAALVERKQVSTRAPLHHDEWRARGFAVGCWELARARRADRCIRSALRFGPSGRAVARLDAAVGALAYALAMWLRFLDEGVPSTYAQRLLPWLIAGALVQVAAGEVMNRLRKPGARFADRPVAPFLLGGLVSLVPIVVNELLGEPWHLPHTVAVVAPLLATAGSAALRLAASRVFATEVAAATDRSPRRVRVRPGPRRQASADRSGQARLAPIGARCSADLRPRRGHERNRAIRAGSRPGVTRRGCARTCMPMWLTDALHEMFERRRRLPRRPCRWSGQSDRAFVSSMLGTLFICSRRARGHRAWSSFRPTRQSIRRASWA